MVTEKQMARERAAIKKIREIVNSLEEKNYVETALEGYLDLAEDNIRNDFYWSMKRILLQQIRRADDAEENVRNLVKELEKTKAELVRVQENLNSTQEKLQLTQRELGREQEWKAYEDDEDDNVKDHDYLNLYWDDCTRHMSDDEAVALLNEWFGFAKNQITIIHTIPVYEINQHQQLRVFWDLDRMPLYKSIEENYALFKVRFPHKEVQYELYNGSLRVFTDPSVEYEVIPY